MASKPFEWTNKSLTKAVIKLEKRITELEDEVFE
jgi:hypothetical protein